MFKVYRMQDVPFGKIPLKSDYLGIFLLLLKKAEKWDASHLNISRTAFLSGILAGFMFKNYGPSSGTFLTIWIDFTPM